VLDPGADGKRHAEDAGPEGIVSRGFMGSGFRVQGSGENVKQTMQPSPFPPVGCSTLNPMVWGLPSTLHSDVLGLTQILRAKVTSPPRAVV